MFPDTPEHRSSAVTCHQQGQNEGERWSGMGREGRGLGGQGRLGWPSTAGDAEHLLRAGALPGTVDISSHFTLTAAPEAGAAAFDL